MSLKSLVLSIPIAALAFVSTIGIADQAKAHTNYCGHEMRVYSGTAPLTRIRFLSSTNVSRGVHVHIYAHEIYNFSRDRWDLVHNYDRTCNH